MRILVAEDQPELRRMLVKNLTAAGYTVDGVPDGEEALAYLDAADYDVAVLDIMMPKVDGLTVLRTLRGRDGQLPVLLLTARDAVADRVDGLDAGAVLFQVILVGAFHDNGCIVGSGKVQETGKQGFFAEIAAVLRVETDLLLFQLIHGNDLVDGVIFPGHPGCDLPVCLRMEHRVKSHRIKLCSVAVCRFLSQFQDQAAVNSTGKCQAGVSLRIFIQKCF